MGTLRTLIVTAALTSSAFVRAQPATGPATAPVAPDYSSRILTPAPGPEPRINGPRIYGQRPGNPVLYKIPATGDKPLTYAAEGLPPGLSIDPATGRIIGKIAAAGEYPVKLKVTNARGTDEKPLKIVIGDKIALTPPLGWNSWNCWAESVDQEKVLRSARAMVASGLVDHGWTYINIDDTWQGKRTGADLALQPNEKFPDMKALCDEIHAMGLKAGIYSTPWVTSYASFPGGSADADDGTWVGKKPTTRGQPNPNWVFGKNSYANADAKQWAAWGFDYLKYDWNPNDVEHVTLMADALKASGRDIVYSLSNAAPFDHAADWAKLANAWRTTGDINDSWVSMAGIGFEQSRWAEFGGPGHWNDPDMLVVGWVGWGPRLHPTKLTADEQYTHITLWSLLAAPMLIGCDLERMDPFTLSLLTNDEVLAVNQDPLGKQATCVSEQGEKIQLTPARGNRPARMISPAQVWARQLEDGSYAVGLFNLSNEKRAVVVSFTALKTGSKQKIRDLWRQKDLGTKEDEFEMEIEPHGAAMIKLMEAK